MLETTDYLIEASQLLVLPEVYVQVKNAIDDPEIGLNQVTKLIGHDAVMSARILKLANSPIYSYMAKIDQLDRAVTVLGTKTIHDLVLASSIAQTFNGLNGVNYDVETFWRDSLMRAAVARSCAAALQHRDCAQLFLTGLLSDIGHMVMSIREPQLMQRVLLQHQKTGHPLHLYERSSFGFDFGELGADLLKSWHLPETLVQPIRYQNCPELSPEMRIEAAIMYCASRVQSNEYTFPSIIDIETLGQCGITQLDYDAVRADANALYTDACALFPLHQLKEAV